MMLAVALAPDHPPECARALSTGSFREVVEINAHGVRLIRRLTQS